MTKKGLVKFLVDNFKDAFGNLDLSKLDFTNEDIKCVNISRMKVNGVLFQDFQKVKGDLWQEAQEVGGDLIQSRQTVEGQIVD